MKTPAEIETDYELPAGSVRVTTTASGIVEITAAGAPLVVECSLWALRCICTRRGFDPAIESGLAALAVNPQGVARAMWNFSGEKLTRSDWIVRKLKVWIRYSERQMDELFSAAAAIEASR